jgi:protein farnesyltransferase subunit beta
VLGPPRATLRRFLDVPLLARWLAERQCAPEGGFAGRANKLVDGCYGHWIAGCSPLLGAALDGAPALFSREDLVRYSLCACQAERGGLRDKPGKLPDAYHTCYVLAGLAAAQHRWLPPEAAAAAEAAEAETAAAETAAAAAAAAGNALRAPLGWRVERVEEAGVGADRVEPLHPVLVVGLEAAEAMRRWCVERDGSREGGGQS